MGSCHRNGYFWTWRQLSGMLCVIICDEGQMRMVGLRVCAKARESTIPLCCRHISICVQVESDARRATFISHGRPSVHLKFVLSTVFCLDSLFFHNCCFDELSVYSSSVGCHCKNVKRHMQNPQKIGRFIFVDSVEDSLFV